MVWNNRKERGFRQGSIIARMAVCGEQRNEHRACESRPSGRRFGMEDLKDGWKLQRLLRILQGVVVI